MSAVSTDGSAGRVTAFRFFTRVFAPQLIGAAYRGILGREAEPNGLHAYARSLANSRDLAEILRDFQRSDECWQQSIADRSEDLIRSFYQGLLNREPGPAGLEHHAAELAEGHNLAALLREICQSEEHWNIILDSRANGLIREFYLALLGREPEREALENGSAKLLQAHDLRAVLADLCGSDEHWQLTLGRRAHDLVRAVYLGLLGREPELKALESFAAKLARTRDLAGLLAGVSGSDEHWKLILSSRSEDVVRGFCHGILGRDPEPDELASLSAALAKSRNLADLVHSIDRSDDTWRKSLGARSSDLVRAVYQGLLGREPDEKALANCSAKLAQTADLATLLTTVVRSDEFLRLPMRFSGELGARDAYEAPALVFLHLQKTAGTTLQDMLSKTYGQKIYREHNDRLDFWSPRQLARYSVFAGHFNYDSLAFIPRRTLSIFTFVRHPKERLISLYYFWRAHEPSSPHFHIGMKAANELSIEEFFEDEQTIRKCAHDIWNHQTWGIMGRRQWLTWKRLLARNADENSAQEYVSQLIRPLIRQRLREFLVVGLQDEFEKVC